MRQRTSYLNFGIISMTSFIGIVNSFYYLNFEIMLTLCAVEILILFYTFFRKNYGQYICLYLIFLAFSMESENFVGDADFYGFKNFRLFGVNLATLMIIPIALKAIINFNKFKLLNYELFSVLKMLTYFTVIGSIMGVIIYILDDYGFSSKEGSLKEMVNTYYYFFIPYVTFLSLSWGILNDPKAVPRIKQYLFSCIPATAIVFSFCYIFGNYGNRMGNESLQVSEIYFILVSSLVLISFHDFSTREKFVILVSGSIIALLSIMYNASGKILIMVMITPLIWLFIYLKQSAVRFQLKHILGILLFLFVMLQITPKILGYENNVLIAKTNDISGLISFVTTGDLKLIPDSPMMRISEFINVGYEYIIHPWFLFFGKGFIGSVQDHLGLFPTLNEFDFSEWQLELEAYHSLHESFNVFFLTGGLAGLYILVKSLYIAFHNINYSPWLVFGGIWLLFFYGYHMNVSIFGITCLVIGLYEVNNRKIKDAECLTEKGDSILYVNKIVSK